MSKYTTELRYVVIDVETDIGLTEYPIFEEIHRTILNKKIVDHYYFREIGVETVELFKFMLKRKMNEIMPYYNELYRSASLDFNPLWNVEMHETFTHTTTTDGTVISSGINVIDGSSTETMNGSSTNIGVAADTPQGSITDLDITSNKYASKTEHDKNTNTGTGATTTDNTITENNEVNQSNTNTETYTKLLEGSSAGLPYSNAIKQWREIMINVDMQIIEELEPLFIQLW